MRHRECKADIHSKDHLENMDIKNIWMGMSKENEAKNKQTASRICMFCTHLEVTDVKK